VSAYRVEIYDVRQQGKYLTQQDFAKRPTQAQVLAAFPCLSQPGRREVRLGLISGEDVIHAGGWVHSPAPVDQTLFDRTAPEWNCVTYADGPHYTPGSDCLWCGKSVAQIAAEYDPS